MDDTQLMAELTKSYRQQLAWYQELVKLQQKTLSRLILSRGSVSLIMGDLERKQKIFETIATERAGIHHHVDEWQLRKDTLSQLASAKELNALLATTEQIIKTFLDSEDQMKKYLESIINKGAVST